MTAKSESRAAADAAVDLPRSAAEVAAAFGAELRRPTSRRVRLHAAAVIGVYAGFSALALMAANWALRLLVVGVLGFMLAGCSNAAHDCVHRTHLRTARGNRVAGAAWCTPVLLNFSVYRYQHLLHHRFTGVDGDTESGASYRGVRQYVAALLAVGYWRFVLSITLAGLLRQRGRLPASVQRPDRLAAVVTDSRVILAWVAVAATATAFAPLPLLLCYWIPLVLSGPATLLLSLPEHYGLRGSADWTRNTRSVRSNPLVRFVMWNANFHAEHHAVPWVPSVNLPVLYRAMGCVEYRRERSYVTFHLRLLRTLTGTGRGGT